MLRPPHPAPLRPALLTALLLPSCSLFSPRYFPAQPVPAYYADPAETLPLRRVIVLPFAIEDAFDADPDLVWDAFCAELQKTSRFDVMALPPEARGEWLHDQARRSGLFPRDVLLSLLQKYSADALVHASLTRFRAYKPPALGLRAGMVSTHTGKVVWECDVLYDMADQRSLDDLRNYASTVSAPEESDHDWEMTLLSPRKFAGYVCHRVVDGWRDAGR